MSMTIAKETSVFFRETMGCKINNKYTIAFSFKHRQLAHNKFDNHFSTPIGCYFGFICFGITLNP